MAKRRLLSFALACAIITPVVAQPHQPTAEELKALQDQAAYLKAQNDILTQQNAAATTRFAPVQGFAGNGTTTPGANAGEMETAYLAMSAMDDVAAIVSDRVAAWFRTHPPAPGPGSSPGIVVLTEGDTLTFDNLTAFEVEAAGVRQAFLRALSPADAARCPSGDEGTKSFVAGIVPLAGAVLSLLQTTTTVQGLHGLGDDGMFLSALTTAAPDTYIQRDALLNPEVLADNPVNIRLIALEECERAARARPPVDPAHPTDAEKALQAIVVRSETFRARLTTGAANVSPPLAAILVQAELRKRAVPYALRTHVVLSGGSMITRKNLWTAIGFPGLTISGGVIVRFRLTDNRTGRSVLGGNVLCRTGQMGLEAAMRMQRTNIRCTVNAPAPGQNRGTAILSTR